MIKLNLQVRRAVVEDNQQIASLLFHEANLHRHLDWRSPLDWLGSPNYWVLEEGGRILGTLACPEDPPSIMWIRLFGYLPHLSAPEAWSALWQGARAEIQFSGQTRVAAIVIKHWFQTLLISSGFKPRQEITLLELAGENFRPAPIPREIQIRPMLEEDLQAVSGLDFEAFGFFWHNSFDALTRAYLQAVHATVAEAGGDLIGYQLSTGNPFGAHLSRLAVRPRAQGRGIGAALVSDLIHRLGPLHLTRLSVNTQSDNAASLALYRRLGFAPTGERFPVLTFPGGG